MAKSLKERVLELKKSGKTISEIQATVKKEGIKTNKGNTPSPGYLSWILSTSKNGKRKSKAISAKKPSAQDLVNLSMEGADQVFIIFGPSEKVERALESVRAIYEAAR